MNWHGVSWGINLTKYGRCPKLSNEWHSQKRASVKGYGDSVDVTIEYLPSYTNKGKLRECSATEKFGLLKKGSHSVRYDCDAPYIFWYEHNNFTLLIITWFHCCFRSCSCICKNSSVRGQCMAQYNKVIFLQGKDCLVQNSFICKVFDTLTFICRRRIL